MVDLLTFIVRFCATLFEKPGFRFMDSGVGAHAAAGAWILLESTDVQIYMCKERESITWEIRSLHDSNKKNWFSFDLVSQLLDRPVATGIMTLENSEFLSENLVEIIQRFTVENAKTTIKDLTRLKGERAKRL